MKKIILIAFSLCLLFLGAFAQKGKEIIIGVGVAAANTWIINQNFYGEPEIDYAPKFGYAASLNLGYNFTGNIAMITELQYSHQGQKYDGEQHWPGGDFNDVTRDIKLYYLNIPVFFKYAFGKDLTKFRFMVGPQFGILMNAEQEYLRDGTKQPTTAVDAFGHQFNTTETVIKDRYENLDIGVAFDIGTDITLSDLFYISAGLRFNYGFKDVNAEPYHLENYKGEVYEPSNNLWGGVYVGICYKLDIQGYSQRSF
jgi:hypothetical protein